MVKSWMESASNFSVQRQLTRKGCKKERRAKVDDYKASVSQKDEWIQS